MAIGDLNDIIANEEKQGGRPSGSPSTGLLHFLLSNRLIDLGYGGNKSTRSNRREGKYNFKERLDRGIANTHWRQLHPDATIIHLPNFASDHSPLLLNTTGNISRGPWPFRFEAMWLQVPSCYAIIKNAWTFPQQGFPMFKLKGKIEEMKKALKKWNKEEFGHVQTKVKQLTD